ncbi:Uncharacterized protein Rs2_03737 [Raphanus sativus]|uniref:Uncharacterized protein LOC108840678 n=1 Tax=Raphanus sativus TaxID=3726 RepID=A0A6J0M933_RAPSA|nr:uncharacterized protein LOC108840678 [Raphanus sativus]KAJ4909116.1 Uncharacterized protein Rs2_03737 [Raphanus sativus]
MVSRQEGALFSSKRDLKIFGEEFHKFKKTKLVDQSHGKLQSTRPIEPLPCPRTYLERTIEPKVYSRTSEDHMTNPKDLVVVGRPKMSLDLQLNLSPSYSPSKTTTKIVESSNHNVTVSSPNVKNLTSPREKTTLSWLAFDGGDDVDHKEQEMVPKVCMKCHMLVMLSTSTPVCPNCKFMHPRDHSSTKLFKPPNLLWLLC